MSVNMKYFDYGHLPPHLQVASSVVHTAAWTLMPLIPEGPEKDAGYRKLLEAKDCFVRAALESAERHDSPPVKCKRNTYEDCNCGQCQNRKNYAAHLH